MSNNYSKGTFEPTIPTKFITPDDIEIFTALGINMYRDTEAEVLYLYNEESISEGDIEKNGEVIQVGEDDLYLALQKIVGRSNGALKYIHHEEAHTCDKMRIGEFGGSAVFITADDIRSVNTSSWLMERINEAETGDVMIGAEDDDTGPNPTATQELIDVAQELGYLAEAYSGGESENAKSLCGQLDEILSRIHKPDTIIKSLVEACVQARAALPDAYFAVKSNVPTEVIDLLNKALFSADKAGFAVGASSINNPITTWDYNIDGQHSHFDISTWREDIINGSTMSGYQKWVEHNVETLVFDTKLATKTSSVWVAAIGFSGYEEVYETTEAMYFTVFTETNSERGEDICEFNTLEHALEFANKLADLHDLPVCCSVNH